MRTAINTTAYLESLSTLARRGFATSQAGIDVVLQHVTEQLGMRSSFLTYKMQEEQIIAIAAYNEPEGCAIAVNTMLTFAPLFFHLADTSSEPLPLLIEDLRHEHPTYTAINMGCYISVPVILSDGKLYGTLCAADPQPQTLSPLQAKLLIVLARLLATQFERERELMDRKWAENELAQALAMLQRANEQREATHRLRSNFVRMINHEFRTALTGIQGFSELMRDQDFSFEEIKEYATDINADAQRLTEMINQLLTTKQRESEEE